MTNHSAPDRPVAGDWLALREPADAAAREDSLPLIARIVRHWEQLPPAAAPGAADTEPVVVVDLGAGTGANRAWLARHLPGPQRWILLDHDRELLDQAVAAARAEGPTSCPSSPGSRSSAECSRSTRRPAGS